MNNKSKEQKPRTPGIVSLPTSLTRRSRVRGLSFGLLRLVIVAAPLNAVVRPLQKARVAQLMRIALFGPVNRHEFLLFHRLIRIQNEYAV